jgi:hypothetical protein
MSGWEDSTPVVPKGTQMFVAPSQILWVETDISSPSADDHSGHVDVDFLKKKCDALVRIYDVYTILVILHNVTYHSFFGLLRTLRELRLLKFFSDVCPHKNVVQFFVSQPASIILSQSRAL